MDQDEVVDIAHVPARLQFVLDELIQPIQIDIGEELRTEVADRQAATRRRIGQSLVRGNTRELFRRSAQPNAGLQGRMPQQRMRRALQHQRRAVLFQHRLQDAPQNWPMNGIEEVVDVELQEVAAALATVHLAHELLYAPYRGVTAFALAVGEAICDEPRLPDRLDRWHQPVVCDAVHEIGRMDFARLRMIGHETGARTGMPCSGLQRALESQQSIGPMRFEIELVAAWLLAVARRAPGVIQRPQGDRLVTRLLILTGRPRAHRPHAGVVVAVVVVGVAVVEVDDPRAGRVPRLPANLRPGRAVRCGVARHRHWLAPCSEASRVLSIWARFGAASRAGFWPLETCCRFQPPAWRPRSSATRISTSNWRKLLNACN